MTDAFARHNISSHYRLLAIDNQGAQVETVS
jgi:hypothetical protein